jgi:polyisoprenoid-binding protein YceI
VARFTAEGEIRRSEFGMTADRTLISDLITIAVDVTILV